MRSFLVAVLLAFASVVIANPITVDLRGPSVSESDSVNPFTAYQMAVVWTQGERTMTVPGFFAADGDAARTGAQQGNVWRSYFRAPNGGTWSYRATLKQGETVIAESTGSRFQSGYELTPNLQAKDGILYYGNVPHYGHGMGSPENFLSYRWIVDTPENSGSFKHEFLPHGGDYDSSADRFLWRPEAKAIFGAVRFLAQYSNEFYLVYNQAPNGDDNDNYPYTSRNERWRFDVSKTDRQRAVLEYMEDQGIIPNIFFLEMENSPDNVYSLDELKFYAREFIARFGHINFTLCISEEGRMSTQRKKDLLAYLHEIDPYKRPLTLHNTTSSYDLDHYFDDLVGYHPFSGISYQLPSIYEANSRLNGWRTRVSDWVIRLDETGPANVGAPPNWNTSGIRDHVRYAMFGSYATGATAINWYNANDHRLENFRDFESLLRLTHRAAQRFVHVPYQEFPQVQAVNAYARASGSSAIVFPFGGTTKITMPPGNYTATWYDVQTDAELTAAVQGPEVTLVSPYASDFWIVTLTSDVTGPLPVDVPLNDLTLNFWEFGWAEGAFVPPIFMDNPLGMEIDQNEVFGFIQTSSDIAPLPAGVYELTYDIGVAEAAPGSAFRLRVFNSDYTRNTVEHVTPSAGYRPPFTVIWRSDGVKPWRIAFDALGFAESGSIPTALFTIRSISYKRIAD